MAGGTAQLIAAPSIEIRQDVLTGEEGHCTLTGCGTWTDLHRPVALQMSISISSSRQLSPRTVVLTTGSNQQYLCVRRSNSAYHFSVNSPRSAYDGPSPSANQSEWAGPQQPSGRKPYGNPVRVDMVTWEPMISSRSAYSETLFSIFDATSHQ
jgi:hypothetical protein